MRKLGYTIARNSHRGRGKGDLKFSAVLKGMVSVVQAVKDTSASGFSNHKRKEFLSLKEKKAVWGIFA